MSKTLKITLIVIAVLFGAAILVTGGVVLGEFSPLEMQTPITALMIPANLSVWFRYVGGWFSQQGNTGTPFGMGPGMMGRGFRSGITTNSLTGKAKDDGAWIF